MHDFLVLDVVLFFLLVAPSLFLAVCYATGSHFLFQCYLQYTVLSAHVFFFSFLLCFSFSFGILKLIDFFYLYHIGYSTTHRAVTYFHSVLELCWYGVPYILLYMCCDHGSVCLRTVKVTIHIYFGEELHTNVWKAQSANFHPMQRRLTSERSEPLVRRPKSRREKWAKYADSATFVRYFGRLFQYCYYCTYNTRVDRAQLFHFSPVGRLDHRLHSKSRTISHIPMGKKKKRRQSPSNTTLKR
jgi:hypothetical protein